MIYPAGYLFPAFGGVFNPYFGGFGHFNHPLAAGAGFAWPGFTYPYNFQSPLRFAIKAGFIA